MVTALNEFAFQRVKTFLEDAAACRNEYHLKHLAKRSLRVRGNSDLGSYYVKLRYRKLNVLYCNPFYWDLHVTSAAKCI